MSYYQQNTQLSKADGYDVTRMIFSEPKDGSIQNSKITFKRISISTRNDDDETIGDLVFPTESCYSFGLTEETNEETGLVTGYKMPISMWARDGATKEQQIWTDTFERIVNQCKKHLIEIRKDLKKPKLEMAHLDKFAGCMWWKTDDDGERIPNSGPVLYAKIIISKKQNNKILTKFYGENDEELKPLELKGKPCFVVGAIKVESIFIGNKITIIVKLCEADIDIPWKSSRRLLPKRPTSQAKVEVSESSNVHDALGNSENNSGSGSEPGSVENSPKTSPENSPVVVREKQVVKKVIRRVVRKKVT